LVKHVLDVTQTLRGILPWAVDRVHKALLETAFGMLEPILAENVGPKETRVLVFGPYAKEGQGILRVVAQKVASLGYGALTGFGYCSAEEPQKFRALDEILPKTVLELREIIPSYTYLHEFPRLGSKAVFYQNQERAQVHELIGCCEYEIPALGFIVHNRIAGRTNSTYLAYAGRMSQCVAYDKSFCGHEKFPGRFCPFFDSIPMPWATLQLFLTKANSIIAVKALADLDVPLRGFLQNGVSKREADPRSSPAAIRSRRVRRILIAS
jgi:hypothetical protein